MMTRFLIVVCALAFFSAAGSAFADPMRSNWANPHASPVSQDEAREGVRSGRLMSLDEVLRNVRARVPGRLLDAELGGGQNPVYRIKILSPGGNMVHVIADARSGRILKVQGR